MRGNVGALRCGGIAVHTLFYFQAFESPFQKFLPSRQDLSCNNAKRVNSKLAQERLRRVFVHDQRILAIRCNLSINVLRVR